MLNPSKPARPRCELCGQETVERYDLHDGPACQDCTRLTINPDVALYRVCYVVSDKPAPPETNRVPRSWKPGQGSQDSPAQPASVECREALLRTERYIRLRAKRAASDPIDREEIVGLAYVLFVQRFDKVANARKYPSRFARYTVMRAIHTHISKSRRERNTRRAWFLRLDAARRAGQYRHSDTADLGPPEHLINELRNAVAALPDDSRLLIQARYLDANRRSYRDLGREVNRTPEAVRNREQRILRNLAATLGGSANW